MLAGYLATWSAVFFVSEDATKAGGPELIAALEDGNNELLFRLSAGLGLIASAMLAVYAAGVRRALGDVLPARSILPNIVFTSFVGAAAVLAVGFLLRGMIFDSSGYYGDDPRIAFYAMSIDIPLGAWGLLGIASGASAYAALWLKAIPRWFGIVSAIVTVLVVLIWLTGTPPPANIPAGPWLLASVFAFRNLGASEVESSRVEAPSVTPEPALG